MVINGRIIASSVIASQIDLHAQYGGVTAPGNAPWVLTVGASSHMGTTDRADDVMATFSSRGPTRFDYAAKPAEQAGPGDIIAIAGIADIMIGDTLADLDDPQPLPLITVDEPAISMTIGTNT